MYNLKLIHKIKSKKIWDINLQATHNTICDLEKYVTFQTGMLLHITVNILNIYDIKYLLKNSPFNVPNEN